MSTPFLGEIRLFAGNFAPMNWALCNGQLLPIAQNTALFQLLGTFYGGDGVSTFALPDLRSRVPLHNGGGIVIGEVVGSETVALTTAQMPAHVHPVSASTNAANAAYGPSGNALAATSTPAYATSTPVAFDASSMNAAGSSQPHDNMAPYLTINFIIALAGIFPSRA